MGISEPTLTEWVASVASGPNPFQISFGVS